MKKYIISLLFAFIANTTVVYSQKKIDRKDVIFYQKALKERIFTHYNSSFFLSGENLYYKVYCIKSRSSSLSNLSKVAYVELIDSDKSIIFKHKIRLELGVGNGTFFIPASVPSGNYKLIAYTQWMRNEGNNHFFQGDITILNPFKKNQNLALNKNDTIVANTNTAVFGNKKIDIDKAIGIEKLIELELETKTYKNRAKVELKINGLNNENSYGNYSVSIRKIDHLNKPKKHTSKTYINLYPEKKYQKKIVKEKAAFLPEFNGELVTGKVTFKNTDKPASNIKVALSIPNEKYILKFATTDDTGVFKFNLKIKPEESKATIQVLDDNRENYKILLTKQKPFKYNTISFNKFEMHQKYADLLLEHSIQNQIENTYSSVKQQEQILNKKLFLEPAIKSDDSEIYLLDDYTRFSSVKETMVEIIDNVWITKKKNSYIFHVRNSDAYDTEDLLPLVIMDGILIQNHNELVDYNAKNIKSINIKRNKFTYNSFIFQGIISMETYTKDYKSNLSYDYVKNINLFVPLKNNKYYNQEYDGNKLERIPDYRRQLLWVPKFDLNKKDNIITFYTSDVNGEFEICVEGFTNNGKSISLKEIISVN